MVNQTEEGSSYANVLQELLLALLGHTGDVFLDQQNAGQQRTPYAYSQADPWKCTWKLADDVHWISSSDRDILDELVTLGFHFRCLDSFVAAERDHASLKTGSLYRRALATGLSELLDVYGAAILQIQQHVLRDPCPTLAGLQFFLSEFKVLLPPLHFLVHEVHTKQLTGSQLLQLLHYKAQCGVPVLQSCLGRLLWHCNQVLYKQLSAWMVHGMLLDRQNEFFIQHAAPAEEDAFEQAGAWSSHSANAYEWHKGYQVAVAELPPHITLSTAESILFVGKAVQVLQQPPGAVGAHGLLPQNDALAFADALRTLQQQPSFNQNDFERTVEAIRVKAAGRLWALVVVAGELPAHLAALKNYFLLAKGDFYQCFLLESYSLMRLPPRLATAESDVAIPFQQSALKSTAEHDLLFPNVKIRFQAPESAGGSPRPASIFDSSSDIPAEAGTAKRRPLHVPSYDKWDNVYLEYKIQWPLHLLLTPEVMSKYNVLFQYLLRLKRIQLELEESWAVMRRQSARARDLELHQRRLPLWQVRHHMSYIITNLQIYIQVDVIEAQSSILTERIANARDFKEAERAHKAFMDALVMQTFLDMKQITQMLEAIFMLCQRMCGIIQKDDGSRDVDAANPEKVDSLSKDFRRRANMLYTLLQSNKLQSSQRAPYLRQFLLRLNYNGYVEQEAVRQLRM
ncbi:hypothetical protein WJX72_009639 [[Myrmecia] bisecta]|uniref:Gamma-tubulin complex component n=1 Tax=[Myrmecia] bisecta TaxID=41462 RepID=A0AAW1P4S7_9CHLO